MLIRPVGRPRTKDVWTDRIEALLVAHGKTPDIRRFRQRCEGYTDGQIATRELISPDTVKGSIKRCRSIIRHGKAPAANPRTKKIYSKKVVAADQCELCRKGKAIVWTEEHEKVCGRCYFILRRVRDEIEMRDVSDIVVDDVFLRVLEIA